MQSEIECGFQPVDAADRIFSLFVQFFNQKVQIFRAAEDIENRTLYRTRDLSSLLQCDHSRLGMFLKRRIPQMSKLGMFQASSFKHKPENCRGLRAGGYFLSLESCERVAKSFSSLDAVKSMRKTAAKQLLKRKLQSSSKQVDLPEDNLLQSEQFSGQSSVSSSSDWAVLSPRFSNAEFQSRRQVQEWIPEQPSIQEYKSEQAAMTYPLVPMVRYIPSSSYEQGPVMAPVQVYYEQPMMMMLPTIWAEQQQQSQQEYQHVYSAPMTWMPQGYQ